MYERSYTVLPSDVGPAGAIKPRNLLNVLQDTADMAVASLKADMQSAMEKGYAWIVVNMKISAERWPELGERIVVRTWHNATDGLYTFRAFDVRSGGAALVSGSTSWLLFDLARSRPVKPAKNLPVIIEDNPDVPRAFADLPRNFDAPSTAGPGAAREKKFEARLHDLDANGHVNNAVYIEWAVESAPRDILTNCRLAGWDVSYRKGAYFGDEITVNTWEENPSETQDKDLDAAPARVFTGTIKGAEGAFLCAVRTYWR